MVAKAVFANIVLYIVTHVNRKYNTDFYILPFFKLGIQTLVTFLKQSEDCSNLIATKNLTTLQNNYNLLLIAGSMMSYNPINICTHINEFLNNSNGVFIFHLLKLWQYYLYWQ